MTKQQETIKDTPKAAQEAAVTYTVDEFRAASKKLFGYGPEVVDGATYGKTKEAYTVEEMKKLVKDFLEKPVTAEKKEGK